MKPYCRKHEIYCRRHVKYSICNIVQRTRDRLYIFILVKMKRILVGSILICIFRPPHTGKKSPEDSELVLRPASQNETLLTTVWSHTIGKTCEVLSKLWVGLKQFLSFSSPQLGSLKLNRELWLSGIGNCKWSIFQVCNEVLVLDRIFSSFR